jgi:hypothetical protein
MIVDICVQRKEELKNVGSSTINRYLLQTEASLYLSNEYRAVFRCVSKRVFQLRQF